MSMTTRKHLFIHEALVPLLCLDICNDEWWDGWRGRRRRRTRRCHAKPINLRSIPIVCCLTLSFIIHFDHANPEEKKNYRRRHIFHEIRHNLSATQQLHKNMTQIYASDFIFSSIFDFFTLRPPLRRLRRQISISEVANFSLDFNAEAVVFILIWVFFFFINMYEKRPDSQSL